jgi:hypothetical protein
MSMLFPPWFMPISGTSMTLYLRSPPSGVNAMAVI